MLVNGMWCYFPGWGVTKRDGVLLSRMGVSERNGVLVIEIGSYFSGWGVSKRD